MRRIRMQIREWELESIKAGQKTSITRLMRPQPVMADHVLYGGGPYDGWVCVDSHGRNLRSYGRGPCLPGDHLLCVCYPLPRIHDTDLLAPIEKPALCLLVKTVHTLPLHDTTESDAKKEGAVEAYGYLTPIPHMSLHDGFARQWDMDNSTAPWITNPWVWRIGFTLTS